MKTYQETLQILYSLGKKGIKMGLSNMHNLSSHFGNPHQKFPSIHVAGTNGKGSVTTKIAKSYEMAGKKVGLYTSPHISTFRERIQVNGKLISEDQVIHLLKEILDHTPHIPATFFEITTLLAFLFFAREKVDVAVLETGLGGRLDATNIVTPLLSVITSISLDHTDILGSTLESIAYEKGGIIKPQIPVVLGPRVPFLNPTTSSTIRVKGTFPNYDEENQAIAKAALEYLKIPPLGLKRRPPCRLEEIQGYPVPIILDVAHNPDGLQNLFKAVKYRPLRVICGISKNKDLKSNLDIISSHSKFIHLTQGRSERAAASSDLAHFLQQQNYCDFSEHSSIQDALQCALKHSDPIVVCGTFFIMGEIRDMLGLKDPKDPLLVHENFVETFSPSHVKKEIKCLI